MKSTKCAFTLIEMLVVIAILVLLAGLVIPAVTGSITRAKTTTCLSNQRQIGIAMLAYAAEHNGRLPQTTHSVGSFRRERAWIYVLAPYLDKLDSIRVCPTEPKARKRQILERNGSSYVLNDLVFDSPKYNDFSTLPANTLMMFILSEDRAVSSTRDHIHGAEWSAYTKALNDIEPDRTRRFTLNPTPERISSAISENYLSLVSKDSRIRFVRFELY